MPETPGRSGKQRQELRSLLINNRPEQYAAPPRRIPARSIPMTGNARASAAAFAVP
ncbi:hypothetical protein [Streptomyces sp. NPDC018833]|uniref:hypothetical protein n=1 Tax=Streptomyces sp. NPDC018833 TaxID=3365053 RepID=UPI0037BC198D